MIVNPQVFNYRFTIGTLLVAFSALAVISYTSYVDAKSNEDFLKQEKKLLENQISEIISSYDNLGDRNKVLKSELEETTTLADSIYNSLTQMKADLSLINKYRNELRLAKNQQLGLEKKGDSFLEANKKLAKQNVSISGIVENQSSVIFNLKNENKALENALKREAVLTANSFEATAYEQKLSGEIIEIDKANKAKNIRVAFVLAKNILIPKTDKELYIQIIGPDNNVVADKGAIQFEESSLIYSSKVNVYYDNETLEVCTNIQTVEPLKEGRYYISVFEKNRRLGGTQMSLN